MGFVPPTSPVVRRMSASDNTDRIVRDLERTLDNMGQSSEATSRNLQAVEARMREFGLRFAEQERIERNLAATGREPLPSEQKILAKQPKRKIVLE